MGQVKLPIKQKNGLNIWVYDNEYYCGPTTGRLLSFTVRWDDGVITHYIWNPGDQHEQWHESIMRLGLPTVERIAGGGIAGGKIGLYKNPKVGAIGAIVGGAGAALLTFFNEISAEHGKIAGYYNSETNKLFYKHSINKSEIVATTSENFNKFEN